MGLSLILLSQLGVPGVRSLTTDQVYERFFKEIRKFDEFHIAFIDLCKSLNDAMPGKHFTAPTKEDLQEFYEDTWSETPEHEKRKKLTAFVEGNVKELKTDHYRAVIITGMVVPAAAVVLKNTTENIQLVKQFKLHLIPNFVFVPTCTFLALYLMALIVYNRLLNSPLGVPGVKSLIVRSLTTDQIYKRFFMGRAIRKFDEFHIAFIDLCKLLNDAMPGKHFSAPTKDEIMEFYEDTWSKTPEPERREELTAFMKEKLKELKTDHYRAVIITSMVVPAAAVVLKNTAENIQLMKRFKLHLIPNFLFVPTCTFLALYLVVLIVYNRCLKSPLGVPGVSSLIVRSLIVRSLTVKSLTTAQIYERFLEKEIRQFDEFHTAFIDLCKLLNDAMPGKHFSAPTKDEIMEFYEDTWSKTLEPKRRKKLTLFVTEKAENGGPHRWWSPPQL